ncbi:hypothetical protein PR048_024431 [Dryococelus australis]|uniref:Uncharacterized protein n=1 Tax=Dryococelus australis TaxID=614101 RepID=A0ABQ9GNL3_9NEOP|nr:hypothetical protein PR048_024431 [Dryococelus australis]
MTHFPHSSAIAMFRWLSQLHQAARHSHAAIFSVLMHHSRSVHCRQERLYSVSADTAHSCAVQRDVTKFQDMGQVILIKRHLLHDDEKFRALFRLNIQQFDYVLELMKEELTFKPCNRIPQPITAAGKRALTLSVQFLNTHHISSPESLLSIMGVIFFFFEYFLPVWLLPSLSRHELEGTDFLLMELPTSTDDDLC